MNKEEAVAWLSGLRSLTNTIPSDDFGTWQVRIAQADAAMMQQAYWVLRAHADGLMNLARKDDTK